MTSVETRVGFDTAKNLMLKHKLYLTYEISAAASSRPLYGLHYLWACFLDIDLTFI